MGVELIGLWGQRSRPDKERQANMSSMWRAAVMIAMLLAAAPSGSAQSVAPAYAPAVATQSVSTDLDRWRALRQSSGYRFSDYAPFLIANPDWPDAARMRGWAERAMQPGEDRATVISFFANGKPNTGNGWARLAEALAANGSATQALDAGRNAWASPDLGPSDEQAIWTRFGASLTRADNDNRVDALLFAKKADDAARLLTGTSPERQAAFAARVAMQQSAPDADGRYQAVIGSVTRDSGLMIDRARWLRANNFAAAAQQLAARDHEFTFRPADPERFFDMLVQLAGDAADARNWQTAYAIASQIDDVLPAGSSIADQPIAVRDDYTTLAWLAGSIHSTA